MLLLLYLKSLKQSLAYRNALTSGFGVVQGPQDREEVGSDPSSLLASLSGHK